MKVRVTVRVREEVEGQRDTEYPNKGNDDGGGKNEDEGVVEGEGQNEEKDDVEGEGVVEVEGEVLSEG